MTEFESLGSIEQVDLRELWPNEEADFTPWLAEHISTLGEILGMSLDVRGHDLPVRGYSLDILAYDLVTSRSVVIENQLATTDHEHLGKLLTYALGIRCERGGLAGKAIQRRTPSGAGLAESTHGR